MDCSSRPWLPEVGWPDPVRAVSMMPGDRGDDTRCDVTPDDVAVEVDAGEPGGGSLPPIA